MTTRTRAAALLFTALHAVGVISLSACTSEPDDDQAALSSPAYSQVTQWATAYCEDREAACSVVYNDAYVSHCVAYLRIQLGCYSDSNCPVSATGNTCAEPVCDRPGPRLPACSPWRAQ